VSLTWLATTGTCVTHACCCSATSPRASWSLPDAPTHEFRKNREHAKTSFSILHELRRNSHVDAQLQELINVEKKYSLRILESTQILLRIRNLGKTPISRPMRDGLSVDHIKVAQKVLVTIASNKPRGIWPWIQRMKIPQNTSKMPKNKNTNAKHYIWLPGVKVVWIISASDLIRIWSCRYREEFFLYPWGYG
jgi:hypothetical protein